MKRSLFGCKDFMRIQCLKMKFSNRNNFYATTEQTYLYMNSKDQDGFVDFVWIFDFVEGRFGVITSFRFSYGFQIIFH